MQLCEASHNRKAWLFAGSEFAGRRAATVMSLVQSTKLNGHDPWGYLKDVLEQLQMHPNRRISGGRRPQCLTAYRQGARSDAYLTAANTREQLSSFNYFSRQFYGS